MKISKMTLGTVQLGLNYGIANKEGKPDEDKAFRILDAAVTSGINCFDTAADYGDSEKVIGKYITSAKIERSEIYLVTKFSLGDIKASDVDLLMMRSVEKSLKNLNTDYIDILLIHYAKEFSKYGREITKVNDHLLSRGIIRMAGASCYEYGELGGILENEMYQAFQIPVNILDTRITNGEGAKKLKNKLVFARSVFLQGLFYLDPSNLKGNLKEISHYLIRINEIANELDMTVAQLAISYVKSLGYVDSLVLGADNPEHVRGNARLISSKLLDNEILVYIGNRLKGAPDWLFTPGVWTNQKE